MRDPSQILYLGVAAVALVHTVIGPDHYLPFIVLARAEGWTLRKTLAWTLVCGIGHVLSSILLGLVGAGLGWALSSLQSLESIRGQIASTALIGFGFVYFLWGLWRARRGGHSHVHRHADGSHHAHPHPHLGLELEAVAGPHSALDHDQRPHLARHRRTVWTLFIIFVLGPCEPLIPLLLAPASRHDAGGVLGNVLVFSVVTVAAMLALVAVGTLGIRLVPLQRLERHAHALAGFAIFVSGLMIQLLGV